MFHVHPECQLSLTYAEKWLLKMVAPVLLVALLLVQYWLRYSLYLLASGQVRLWFGQHGCSRLCFKRSGGKFDPHSHDSSHDNSHDQELVENPVTSSAWLVTDSTTFDVEGRLEHVTRPEPEPVLGSATLNLSGRVQGGVGTQELHDEWSALGLGPATCSIVPEPEPASEPGPESTLHSGDSSELMMQSVPSTAADQRQPVHGSVRQLNHSDDVSDDVREVRRFTHAITFKDDADDRFKQDADDRPIRDHNQNTATLCSFSFVVASSIAALVVWVFFGEDMGPIEPSPHVYPESKQVKTTAVFALDQGFGWGCLVFVGMWVVRVYMQHIGESAAHKQRLERGMAARKELKERLPRSLKDFGVSFSYQLRNGKIGIYIQTVDADADDADEMAGMQPGQRVTHVLDGDGANILDGDASALSVHAQLYEASDAELLDTIGPVDERDYPGVQAAGKWVPNEIDDRLEKAKKILDDEARGVVRIKRPFTLLMEQRQRKDASMSWVFRGLNPARCVVQVFVIAGLVFVIAMSIGMASNATNLPGMLGLSVCWLLFVWDFYLFIKEWRPGTPVSDDSGGNHAGAKCTKCFRRIKGQLPKVSSWLLFIIGACFAWQTPFKTAALNNELQAQLWGEAEGAMWMGLDGADALLRRLGIFMIALFALRNISGDRLREQWDNMAHFNAEQKMDEVKFIAMEFLLIGYVMLVSAATQPMACHRDLDSKVKLSADNSIECDFCQANAGIAVLGTAHTYGWLWKCALLCSILYSAGLPIFFFCTIWKYAGTERLHTKEYLAHYGKKRPLLRLNICI